MNREVTQLAEKFFPQINTIFYSRNSNKLGRIFRKNLTQTDVFMGSYVLYKYNCDCCLWSYIVNTMLQMFIQIHKHKDTSYRPNRHLAKVELSAIRSHYTSNGHPLKSANFSVIDKCNIRVLESLYIHKTIQHLNNHQSAEKWQIVVCVICSIARCFLREAVYTCSLG